MNEFISYEEDCIEGGLTDTAYGDSNGKSKILYHNPYYEREIKRKSLPFITSVSAKEIANTSLVCLSDYFQGVNNNHSHAIGFRYQLKPNFWKLKPSFVSASGLKKILGEEICSQVLFHLFENKNNLQNKIDNSLHKEKKLRKKLEYKISFINKAIKELQKEIAHGSGRG